MYTLCTRTFPYHQLANTPRTDPSTRVVQVHTINPEKKTFDRIDRLAARAETFEMELLIDINSELWPVAADDKVIIMCLPVMSSRKMLRRAPNA